MPPVTNSRGEPLFQDLLLFVYHCFDRVVIHGYLSGLSRPEQVVQFFHRVAGVPAIPKEVLSARTNDCRNWVEAFARNHQTPIEWAESGVRKEDYVRPALRRIQKRGQHGVYFILKSLEQGNTFRSSPPKFPTADPNYRILARQRSRFTHSYFYIHDEVLGPMAMRVASFTDRFAAFQAQCLNVHVDFPLLQRLALPICAGTVHYPGIKIHDTRMIRLMEVLLHAGTRVAGWRATQIHKAVLAQFRLSADR